MSLTIGNTFFMQIFWLVRFVKISGQPSGQRKDDAITEIVNLANFYELQRKFTFKAKDI